MNNRPSVPGFPRNLLFRLDAADNHDFLHGTSRWHGGLRCEKSKQYRENAF
jgi:hypothetical protein